MAFLKRAVAGICSPDSDRTKAKAHKFIGPDLGNDDKCSDSHYSALEKSVYNNALFYAEGPYKQWQLSKAREFLGLLPRHALVDLGGGTGDFSSELARLEGCAPGAVTLVDPSSAMLEGAANLPAPNKKMLGSVELNDVGGWAAAGNAKVDRALAKEVVHHMGTPEARTEAWRDLRRNHLTSGGRLLVMTRPRLRIDYPFFDAARRVWADNQPDDASLVRELEEAGYTTTSTCCGYSCRITLGQWLALVRGRVWSTFSAFDDAALEAGCDEIRAGRPDAEELCFEERIIFIVAEC